MASAIFSVPQGFPVGTTLSVYVDRVGDVVPQGPPVSTAVIAGDSTVTLTNLEYGIPYQAGAVISGKWRSFLVEVAAPPQTLEGVIAAINTEADARATGDVALDARLDPLEGAALVDMATQAELDAVARGVGSPNTQTADYTLALADAGKVVEVNSASAKVVTIPTNASVAFAIGTVIAIRRIGAGTVTVRVAGGVVMRNRLEAAGTTDRLIANQWSEVSLCKRGTDEWVLVGDLV